MASFGSSLNVGHSIIPPQSVRQHTTSDKNNSKTDSLEHLFRSNDPAAIPILDNLVKSRIGSLKRIDSSDPASQELHLKVLRVALKCIGIARDKIDSIFEENFQGIQAGQLNRFKEAAQALNATFNFIETIHPDERTDDIIKRLISFFWCRLKMGPVSSIDIPMIELFKKIPHSQQLNILRCGLSICEKLHLGQEPAEICAIFEALWSIPQEERIETYALTSPFVEVHQSGSQVVLLLEAIAKMRLANLPKVEQEAILKAAAELYSTKEDDPYGDRKADFIEIMLLLPQISRLSRSPQLTIRNYTFVVPPETRKSLHQKLASIPSERLVDVIRQGSLLCEQSWCRQDEKMAVFNEIFDLVISEISQASREKGAETSQIAKIPPDQREEVFDCLHYVRSDSNSSFYETLEEVYQLPRGHRLEICKSVSHFANKSRCIRILGKMTSAQRQIIIKYARSLPDRDHYKKFAPGEFIMLMDSFPEGQRMESLKLAYSLCTKITYQDLQTVIYILQCQAPENRINICSWFNQLPVEQILEEIKWFDALEFRGKLDREAKIREHYADKSAIRYECDIVVNLVEDMEESPMLGGIGFSKL